MAQVRIVTDSTADLPEALIKELNITVVPLKVLFGDEVYREGIDLTNKEFYEKLAQSDNLPTTSQPSPGEFQETFEELTGQGFSVVSIHISSHLSGTYQSALVAKKALPHGDIHVINSKNVSMALGLIVLAAARSAKDGKTVAEIFAVVEEVKERLKTYFVVDTLEYLQKGGRIGKASAFLGTMLKIKPILSVEDGLIIPSEKIRGKGKALEHMIENVKVYIEEHGKIHCALVHGNCLDEAVKFHQKLMSELQYCEMIIGEIGAVVGTHVGPGTIALFYYND